MFTSLTATPLALASVVMATEMKGDGKLAGQIVIWSTVLGMGTLFGIIFVLRSVGLL